MDLYWFLKKISDILTIFGSNFKVFEAFNTETSWGFLATPRWIYKCGQQFSEIFYFLLGDGFFQLFSMSLIKYDNLKNYL